MTSLGCVLLCALPAIKLFELCKWKCSIPTSKARHSKAVPTQQFPLRLGCCRCPGWVPTKAPLAWKSVYWKLRTWFLPLSFCSLLVSEPGFHQMLADFIACQRTVSNTQFSQRGILFIVTWPHCSLLRCSRCQTVLTSHDHGHFLLSLDQRTRNAEG